MSNAETSRKALDVERTQPKRIALYVIYDQDGILDGYRRYFLQELRKMTDCIVAIACCTLTLQSQEELNALTEETVVCESKNLPANGWIEGIRHIGWERIYEYDELLMLDDSCFGPFYPLEELFRAAEESDADFYGANKNFADDNITEIAGKSFKHGHLRGSICYFYIIKSALLHSDVFRSYWYTDSVSNNRFDAGSFNEFDFYDYVLDAGFHIGTYQSDALQGYCFDSPCMCMTDLIIKERMPFATIRAFGTDINGQSLKIGYGKDPRRALEYIDEHTDYDVNLIWDYLLRTKNLTLIWQQLQLEYVVSKEHLEHAPAYEKPIGAIVHIYYTDLVESIADICMNFPEQTDFFITTVQEKTKQAIVQAFAKRGLRYTVQTRPNVGADLSSLWVTYADVVTSGKYAYMCCFHDKKSPYSSYGAAHGYQFGVRCYETLMGHRNTILNILNLFEDNPRMGVLGPSMVYHGDYLFSAFNSWPGNYRNTVDIAKRLGLKVDINPSIPPVAPYGSMFWFRCDALKKAIGAGLTYHDFPDHYKPDNTMMHALERIYGLAAQDSGYYYADVVDTDTARSDLVNYQYMLNGLLSIFQRNGQYVGNYETAKVLLQMGFSGDAERIVLKAILKRHIPAPVWKLLKKTYRFLGGKKWNG